MTLQVYQLEAGKQASVEIPTLDGRIETRFDIEREGNIIYIQREGPAKAWNIFLVGIASVDEIENTEMEIVNDSTLIKVNNETNELDIQVR